MPSDYADEEVEALTYKLELIEKILVNHLPYEDESGIIKFTLNQYANMLAIIDAKR